MEKGVVFARFLNSIRKGRNFYGALEVIWLWLQIFEGKEGAFLYFGAEKWFTMKEKLEKMLDFFFLFFFCAFDFVLESRMAAILCWWKWEKDGILMGVFYGVCIESYVKGCVWLSV